MKKALIGVLIFLASSLYAEYVVLVDGKIVKLDGNAVTIPNPPPTGGWDDPIAAISHYPMQNNAGYISDESLGGNNGTLISPFYDYDERAYNQRGQNRYIDAGTNSVFRSTNYTMACWVNWSDLEGPGIIQGMMSFLESSDQNGFSLFYYESFNRVRAYVDRNGSSDWIFISSDADVVTNEWQHWAVTLRGTTLELYKNGVLQADTKTVTNVTFGTNNRLILGKHGVSTSYLGFHMMSHMRVYNIGLTSNQIATIAAANRTNETIDVISTNGLMAYYSCQEADVVRDYGSAPSSLRSQTAPGTGPTLSLDGANAVPDSPNTGREEFSFYYDDIDDDMVMEIPNPAYSGQTNGFTMSLWVTNDNQIQTAGIAVRYKWEYPTGYSSKRDWILIHAGTELQFYIFQQDNNGIYIGKKANYIQASQGWVNITVRYDGGTTPDSCDIFTNGVDASTGDLSGGTFTNASYNSDYSIFLGNYVVVPGPYVYHWKGHIDDYKFWTNVLTDAQVLENVEQTGLKGTPIPNYRDENNY